MFEGSGPYSTTIKDAEVNEPLSGFVRGAFGLVCTETPAVFSSEGTEYPTEL